MTPAEAFDQIAQQAVSDVWPATLSVLMYVLAHMAFLALLAAFAALKFGPYVIAFWICRYVWLKCRDIKPSSD